MDDATKQAFQMIDVNVYQENLFHTKMMLKEFDLNNYLFGGGDITDHEQQLISKKVKREMREIFYGRNLPDLA
jgi:S-adenosylmethionine decarboxylase